jgi:methionine sulfoxide reductase heme-binding subunit
VIGGSGCHSGRFEPLGLGLLCGGFKRVTPWTDRTGRFSPLKTLVLAGTIAPALWLFWRWRSGALMPLPFDEATHFTGKWVIRFILIALAMTPAQHIFRWNRLALVRRMLGIAAFAYAAFHFSLYVGDQKFDLVKVGSEIAMRIYLTIGFLAVLGLTSLAATSTDAMVRRLGVKWKRLHRIAYVIAALGILHFFMQSKIDVTEPTLMLGFFILLMSYRQPSAAQLASPAWLAGVALVSAVLTAALEACWYGLATGVPARLVLLANLQFPMLIRPFWIVLGTGLLVSLASALLAYLRGSRMAVAR